MSKMVADINWYGSFGQYNEYQVIVTSGQLATWIGSQFSNNNTPNQPVYVSFLGDLSNATFSITQYVDANNFYITGIGSPFSDPTSGASGVNITAAQIWDQGQANTIARNSTLSPPRYNTLLAAGGIGGYGGDGGASVDLKNAGISGSLWMFADSYYFTRTPINSAPIRDHNVCLFIHNIIALQTSSGTSSSNAYDATNCKFKYYATTTGTVDQVVAFFQPDTQASGTVNGSQPWTSQYWVAAGTGGYCGNSYSTYISALSMKNSSESGGVKESILWINNISTNPNNWNIQELDMYPFGQDLPVPTLSFFDPYSDGYLYCLVSLGAGWPFSNISGYAIYRIPKNDIVITSGTPTFIRGEYYMGDSVGWVRATWIQNNQELGQIPLIIPSSDADSAYPAQLSDGSFVVPSMDWPAGQYKLRVSQSDTLTSGWPSISNSPAIMTMPYWDDLGGSRWYYQPMVHQEQTWSGKQTDDILISVAHNSVGRNSTITAASGSGKTWTFTLSDANGFRFRAQLINPYVWPPSGTYQVPLNIQNLNASGIGSGFDTINNLVTDTDYYNNKVTVTYNVAPSGVPTINADSQLSTYSLFLSAQKQDASTYWVELVRVTGL